MSKKNTATVIYDGKCRFCLYQMRQLKRFDRSGEKINLVSLHEPDIARKYPEITRTMLMKEIYVIDSRGTKHAGADGIRYLTRHLPLLWPLAVILHLPGSMPFWRWMYRQIAKRRYKLAGYTCEDGQCSIH